jgi:hypothetical protein
MRAYVWEIMFPNEITIELDFPVTFLAGEWRQVQVSWIGGAVHDKMRQFLDMGGQAKIRDLDGIERDLNSENLAKMYRSLMMISGKV